MRQYLIHHLNRKSMFPCQHRAIYTMLYFLSDFRFHATILCRLIFYKFAGIMQHCQNNDAIIIKWDVLIFLYAVCSSKGTLHHSIDMVY